MARPYSGERFLELQGAQQRPLFQDVATEPGSTMVWRLAHRGLNGEDTMNVEIGTPPATTPGDVQVPLNARTKGDPDITDGKQWAEWYGAYVVPAGQTTTRITLRPKSTAFNWEQAGNLVDAVSFETAPRISASTSAGTRAVQRGDSVTLTSSILHQGGDRLDSAVYQVTLPSGTTFVPGSATVNSAPAGNLATLNGRTLEIRLGEGATGTKGGRMKAGAEATVGYKVQLEDSVAAGAKLELQPRMVYNWLPEIARTAELGTATIAPATADLEVTGSFAQKRIIAGEPAEFTVHIVNKGPDPAVGNALDITLPAGLDAVKVTSAGTSCPATPTGNTVSCEFSSLAKGAEATVTVVGKVPGDLTDEHTLTARASVTSKTDDPAPANNHAAFTSGVDTSADLAVTMDSGPAGTPTPGDQITQTVTVTNNGPTHARDVEITTNTAEGMRLNSGQPETGTFDKAKGLWKVGEIASGTSVKLVLAGTVPVDRDLLVHQAAVTAAATPDPNTANNAVRTEVKTTQKAALTVGVTADKDTAKPGDDISYAVSVTNAGPSTAHAVEVTGNLPSGTVLRKAETAFGIFDPEQGLWKAGSLPPGTTVELKLTGIAPVDVPELVHTATLTGATTPDPNGTPGSQPPAPAHQASAAVAVTQSADLDVDVTAAAASVAPDERTTFTVTVTNKGPSIARSAEAVLTLPRNAQETTDDSDGALDQATGIWKIGDVRLGESRDLTIAVGPKNKEDLVLAVAALTSAVKDPNPCTSGSCASATVKVDAGAPTAPEGTPEPEPSESRPAAPSSPPQTEPAPEVTVPGPEETQTSDEENGNGPLAETGSQARYLSIAALGLLGVGGVVALCAWRRKE
ncbi:hypothetical protein [Streptomyces vinaceus]|uniref:hypothetical protein n=1 Tax=Streptomyces vinaceus TaxID=1960 RepID=UPI0037FAFFC0